LLAPRPTVHTLLVGGGVPGVVIDDALAQPQDLVDLALRHRAAFEPPRHNAYPGIELPLPDAVVSHFVEHFLLHARPHLPARRVLAAHGRLAMVTLAPAALGPVQRVCHRDRLAAADDECAIAAVLYLFHDERLGGTSFFDPLRGADETEALMAALAGPQGAARADAAGLPPGYLVGDCPAFRLAATVRPRWNRLIWYDGGRFHNSHIARPDLLRDDPATGRLTLNLFLRCRRKAA
jgi:Family of unknown function (DUF6445)